jgi:hypothetical protein
MQAGPRWLDEIRNRCGAGEFSLVDVSVAAEMRETIRAAGVAGPTDFYDCRLDTSHRAGNGEMSSAQRLQKHPGVGALTGLRADPRKGERFQWGKQIASYRGLVPLE